MALPAPAAQSGEAELLGSYTWTREGEKEFGGFSGLELTERGTRFTAISDHGGIVTGRLLRDARGVVTGVEAGKVRRIRRPDGLILTRDAKDTEGLAQANDGTLYISFERHHRVMRLDRPGGRLAPLPRDRRFGHLLHNAGLEALAIDAAGRLHAIPERSGYGGTPFPVYRFDGEAWEHAHDLPRRGKFLVVGADFGPDGRLYILERAFRAVTFSFASRVRVFTLGERGVEAEETLLVSRFGEHDNLEAIDIWQDAAGGLRMTLLSDDNFLRLQVTEFVDYRLSP